MADDTSIRTPRSGATPPADAPAEAVERIAPKLLTQPQSGDIALVREPAGPAGMSAWRYSLRMTGEQLTDHRVFAKYDVAIARAEELASERRVRLFYVEDGIPVLLMDYRRA